MEEKVSPITEDEIRKYYDKKIYELEMVKIEVDTYLYYFLDQQRQQSRQKTFMKAQAIAKKVHIKKDIAEIDKYISQNSLWADLFNIVASYYQNLQNPIPKETQILR